MSDAIPIMRGGATVWCINGHDPKLIDDRHADGDHQACPECGRAYEVDVSIQEVDDA